MAEHEGFSAGPMSREDRLVYLSVEPLDRGFVKIGFKQGGNDIISAGPGYVVLQYPQSGTLIGSLPVEQQVAEELKEASAEFNEVLERWCS